MAKDLEFEKQKDALAYLAGRDRVKVQFLRTTRAARIDQSDPSATPRVERCSGFRKEISAGDTGHPNIPETFGEYAEIVCPSGPGTGHGQNSDRVSAWSVKQGGIKPRLRFVSDAEFARGIKEQAEAAQSPAKESK